MARSRVRGTASAAALVAIFLTVLGAASVGSSDADAAPAPGAKVRTLLDSPLQIRAFAQDGSRIAWIGPNLVHGRFAGCALHIRDLGSGRTTRTLLGSKGCPDQRVWRGALALAGRSAAWVQGAWCGNSECSWSVMRGTSGDRLARVVARASIQCPLTCEFADLEPLLAGADRLLAYSYVTLGRVHTIAAGGLRSLFTARGDIRGLAAGQGRVAAVSLTLRGGPGSLDVPAWSPDGTTLAVAHGAFMGTDWDDYPIGVMNADGSALRDLPSAATCLLVRDNTGAGLTWSPDGQKIAYSDCSSRIHVVNADGSADQLLADGAGPAWSPDGTKIAFGRATNRTPAIYVMNPDGSNVQKLADVGTRTPFVGPLAWSPDGTRIAFSVAGALEVMNADGSNAHDVGAPQGHDPTEGDEPTWSPDSSQIAFRGTKGLFVIGADGTGLRRLTSGSDEHPSWSPDGKTIVFARWVFTTVDGRDLVDLYAVDPDGSNVRPLEGLAPVRIESTATVHSSKGRTSFSAPGIPAGVALTDKVAAVGSVDGGIDRITLFNAATGKRLATVRLGAQCGIAHRCVFAVAGASSHWVVFHIGRGIQALNIDSRKVSRLATLVVQPLDLSVSGRRVAWLERLYDNHSRIRAVDLPG